MGGRLATRRPPAPWCWCCAGWAFWPRSRRWCRWSRSCHPAVYRHADRLAGLPGIAGPACTSHRAGAGAADRGLGQDTDRQCAGRRRHGCGQGGLETLASSNVLYHGMSILGGGAVLGGHRAGLDHRVHHRPPVHEAAAFAGAGAVLTFFGLMHSEAIGVGMTPGVAASYVVVALLLVAVAKFANPRHFRRPRPRTRMNLDEPAPQLMPAETAAVRWRIAPASRSSSRPCANRPGWSRSFPCPMSWSRQRYSCLEPAGEFAHRSPHASARVR